METETGCDTLRVVEVEAMVDKQAARQSAQDTCNTLDNVKAEGLLDTVADTIAGVDAKKLKDHFAMWRPGNSSMIWPTR